MQAKQLWGKGVGLGVCRFLLKPTKTSKTKKSDQKELTTSSIDLVGNGVIRSSKIDFIDMGLYRLCMSQTGDARIVAMGKGTSTWVRC